MINSIYHMGSILEDTMKRWTIALILTLALTLTGCSILEGWLPPQTTLMPTVSSPFPPGMVETMAVGTITARAAQPSAVTATQNVFLITQTPLPQVPTATLASTRLVSTSPPSGKPYAVQAVGPLYSANFANPAKGCAWQGVAGQVLRSNGEAITGIVVVVTGQLAGVKLDLVGLTGNQTTYGPGGYEIVLGNNPASSTKTVFIQLFDTKGAALSEPYAFDTYATCSKNLAIIIFQQVR